MKIFSGELIDPVLFFVWSAFVGRVRLGIIYGYRGKQLWQ